MDGIYPIQGNQQGASEPRQNDEDDGLVADLIAILSLLLQKQSLIGGLHLKGRASPRRDQIIGWLSEAFSAVNRPVYKIPINVDIERLTGGLDLSGTLATGKPSFAPGILEKANGGLVILNMAERQDESVTRLLARTLDDGGYRLERDGQSRFVQSQLTVIALDESEVDETPLSDVLTDRLALSLDADFLSAQDLFLALGCALQGNPFDTVASDLSDDQLAELSAVSASFAITSLRAPLLAARVARTLAGLQRADRVNVDHMATAIRLVLVPKAHALPSSESEEEHEEAPPPSANDDDQHDTQTGPDKDEIPASEQLIDAVLASLPPGMWARLHRRSRQRNKGGGRKAAAIRSRMKGRPKGYRRGDFRSKDRLSLLATLRAAAPWQSIRPKVEGQRISVRQDDVRIKRYKAASRNVTIFVVDASGSSAFNRLAEAKGAVELMLADCYIRRDEVAVIAFRAEGAELLLSPTRSLARVKAAMGRLPGGGATPLAAGLEKAGVLAGSVTARGLRPFIVVLTEGGANRDRSGATGRRQGHEDALDAAKDLRRAMFDGVVIDTSPRRRRDVAELADALDFDHVALPVADAGRISSAVGASQARFLREAG